MRDLAEIEDYMVNQYMTRKKCKYQDSSRIVKGTLSDPIFSSAKYLKQFLEDGIEQKNEIFKFNCQFCDYRSNRETHYQRHLGLGSKK